MERSNQPWDNRRESYRFPKSSLESIWGNERSYGGKKRRALNHRCYSPFSIIHRFYDKSKCCVDASRPSRPDARDPDCHTTRFTRWKMLRTEASHARKFRNVEYIKTSHRDFFPRISVRFLPRLTRASVWPRVALFMYFSLLFFFSLSLCLVILNSLNHKSQFIRAFPHV